jgi:hypothetical protein
MALTQKFTVTVPCKTYVKRFLEINFGNPVDFSNNPKHSKYFTSLLKKPNKRFDSKYPENMNAYSSQVEVLIRQDVFYRYGWEISRSNIVDFNTYFGSIIKDTSHLYITFKRGFSELKQSIIDYQNLLDLGEDYWQFESIKKEIDRHAPKIKPDFSDAINQYFDNLFLDIAKNRNLITEKGVKHYLERV